MKLLVHSPSFDNACAYWRTLGPLGLLHRKNALEVTFTSTITPQSLALHDAVLFQRASDLAAVQTAASMHVPIIIDWDDPFWLVRPGNPAYDSVQRSISACSRCLEYADQVWVSTFELAQAMREFNGHDGVNVIQNAFVPTLMKPAVHNPIQNGVVVIRGSSSHVEDYDYFRQVFENYRTSGLKLLWLGYRPYWASTDMHVSFTNVRGYFSDILPHVSAEFLCVPLPENSFNQCKSNIAIIEAAMIGAIPIVPSWYSQEVRAEIRGVEFVPHSLTQFEPSTRGNANYFLHPQNLDGQNNTRLDCLRALI